MHGYCEAYSSVYNFTDPPAVVQELQIRLCTNVKMTGNYTCKESRSHGAVHRSLAEDVSDSQSWYNIVRLKSCVMSVMDHQNKCTENTGQRLSLVQSEIRSIDIFSFIIGIVLNIIVQFYNKYKL